MGRDRGRRRRVEHGRPGLSALHLPQLRGALPRSLQAGRDSPRCPSPRRSATDHPARRRPDELRHPGRGRRSRGRRRGHPRRDRPRHGPAGMRRHAGRSGDPRPHDGRRGGASSVPQSMPGLRLQASAVRRAHRADPSRRRGLLIGRDPGAPRGHAGAVSRRGSADEGPKRADLLRQPPGRGILRAVLRTGVEGAGRAGGDRQGGSERGVLRHPQPHDVSAADAGLRRPAPLHRRHRGACGRRARTSGSASRPSSWRS